jgi:hypothetical protein
MEGQSQARFLPTVRGVMLRLVALFVLATAAPAAAQPAPQDDVTSLLREGVRLAQAGEHERAVELFERTRRLVPNDRVDLNLADSLLVLGRWTRAHALLTHLVEDPSVSPLIADLARERLEGLRTRFGTVDVQVFPVPERAVLLLDGRRNGAAARSTELRVPPGTHRLALVADNGRFLARTEVEVAPQERRRVELSPVQAELPRAPRAAPALVANEQPAASFDPWPWIGGAIGVAVAAAVGIVLGFVLTEPQPVAGTLPTVRLPGEMP